MPDSQVRGSVGIITLNRPKALNALSPTLVRIAYSLCFAPAGLFPL
jgi:hypothetical protein